MTERQVIAHCAACSARLGMGRTGSTVTLSPRDSALLTLGEAFDEFGDDDKCPAHACGYTEWTDRGDCTFHNKWFAALAALRKIEEAK